MFRISLINNAILLSLKKKKTAMTINKEMLNLKKNIGFCSAVMKHALIISRLVNSHSSLLLNFWLTLATNFDWILIVRVMYKVCGLRLGQFFGAADDWEEFFLMLMIEKKHAFGVFTEIYLGSYGCSGTNFTVTVTCRK